MYRRKARSFGRKSAFISTGAAHVRGSRQDSSSLASIGQDDGRVSLEEYAPAMLGTECQSLIGG